MKKKTNPIIKIALWIWVAGFAVGALVIGLGVAALVWWCMPTLPQ